MSLPRSDILTFKGSFRKAGLFEKLALCLATWFGAGLMPGAPGTFGALAALPLVILLKYLGDPIAATFLVFFVPLAIWSSGLSAKLLQREDPPEVVIDEVAGLLFTVALISDSWLTIILGFILFRFFDILKPFPIKILEQRVRGGTGIVLDDLAAGLYANLILRIVLFFI